MRTKRTFCTAVVLAGLSLSIPRATAGGPASAEDLRVLLDAGDLKGTIAGANKLLGNKLDPAAAGADKSGIYEVKAEAHLRLKQYNEAAESLAAAARAATDPARASVDHATELLVRRSHNGLYKPVQVSSDGTKLPPIDVADTGARKTAFAALFADEWAAAASKVKVAESAKTLPQLLTAADTIGALRDLELTATESDASTKPAMAIVASHAHDPFDVEIRKLERRAADIKASAEARTTYYAHVAVPAGQAGANIVAKQRMTGLSSRNVSDLNAIIVECKRLGPVASVFANTADDTTATAWDGMASTADRTADSAKATLTADYSSGTADR